jgi:hypothetical protein
MWGRNAGLSVIDSIVPERQSMTSNVVASAKTTARTASMSGRPNLHLSWPPASPTLCDRNFQASPPGDRNFRVRFVRLWAEP